MSIAIEGTVFKRFTPNSFTKERLFLRIVSSLLGGICMEIREMKIYLLNWGKGRQKYKMREDQEA